jgi:hypothetical protein
MLMRPVARMGRRSLVGTMARTAVVAGTATAVAGSVSRHQQAKAEGQAQAQADQQQQAEAQQAAAPAPAVAPEPAPEQDVISQLTQLAALKDQGALTQAEFDAQKARILGG